MPADLADTLVLLTGASRGLGHGIAVHYLERGAHIVGLSRGTADDLIPVADAHGGRVEQWPSDLGDPLPVAQRLSASLSALGRRPARVRLIHNAALLAAPADIAASDPAELALGIRVGVEAPIALTAAFLAATAGWAESDRRVLLVSSGLGRRPMAGSAAYCAQKAALDHFARALALEEGRREHGARVAAVAPGVIDTDMQSQLRGADLGAFPDGQRFRELHASGALASPAEAAARLVATLEADDYGREPVTDARG